MKKRFFSGLLILAVILSYAFSAGAVENTLKTDIFSYTISGSDAILTGVDDVEGKVTVPETLDGYSVTSVANGAFGGSKKITEVILPDTITSIGATCFAYSSSIKTVRLSKSITSVSDGMFYQCDALMGVTVPYGVTSIGENAFAMCPNLVSVTIPNTMQTIADNAFAGSNSVRFHCYLGDGAVGYTYAQSKSIDCEELITVYVNGIEIVFDQAPITDPKRFRTLVPLRAVLEEMGAEIEWYNDMNYAGIDIGDHRLLIKPGEEFMMVDGKVKSLSSPGMEYNNRVLIPIRDVVEAVGGKVAWDEHNKIVNITYNI